MTIKWDPSLNLNIKIIDLQHQQLVKVTNQLLEAIDHPMSDSQVYYFFQEVINYTKYHFKTEEFFLKKFGCNPIETEIHIQEHLKFKTEASFSLVHLLENWLLHHIPNIDKKYVECFHQNNLY